MSSRIVKEFTKGFTTHLPPFRLVLGILQEHYRMIQFVETMPFP